MIKKKVLALGDDIPEGCKRRVILHHDNNPLNPLTDWDQVFLLHSNIPREFYGNEHEKGYADPLEEILDEDGYGTGKFTFREGVVAFPVSAYIHSGISLSMGTIREFPCDPGGWDTTPNAAYMWTDRERFEKMCGRWMEIYDDETKTRRAAKDEDEFRKYLWGIARDELKTFQKYMDGEVFGFTCEVARKFTTTYEDGEVEEGLEWDDDPDEYGCWGFFIDKVDDIDFPRDPSIEVFAAKDTFLEGYEYTIYEWLVRSPHDGMFFKGKNAEGEEIWVSDPKDAKVYYHHPYNIVQGFGVKYDDVNSWIVEKDDLEKENPDVKKKGKKKANG